MRSYRVALLIALATTAGAQQQQAGLPVPESISLEWRNVHVVMMPDSAGTLLYLRASTPLPADLGNHFMGSFNPLRIETWVGQARAFVAERLNDKDTATVRSSAALRGTNGERIYLARRRTRGKWSKERFLVLEANGHEPVLMNGEQGYIGEILDSLSSVALRTPYTPEVSVRELAKAAEMPKPTVPASLRPENRPPPYPTVELTIRGQGTVLVTFVIDVEGAVDMTTVKVLHSPGALFLKAVLDVLPKYRFNPAFAGPTPVRQLVVMPFSFSFGPR